jgi:2-aminoadipate transaminase
VIYCSTFSKILAPGLRLAWIVAPTEVIRKLVQAKQGADLHTATFNQLVAHEISRGGFLDEHIKFIRKVYRERRDVMLAAMDRYFPPEVDWTQPAGGLFLWGTLPGELSADVLLKDAVEQKVAFVPGGSFHPRGGGENTMRLNFSNATPEMITEGIRRLGTLLHEKTRNLVNG